MTLEQLYAQALAEDGNLNAKIDEFVINEKLEQWLTYPQKFLYFLWNYTKKAIYPNVLTA